MNATDPGGLCKDEGAKQKAALAAADALAKGMVQRGTATARDINAYRKLLIAGGYLPEDAAQSASILVEGMSKKTSVFSPEPEYNPWKMLKGLLPALKESTTYLVETFGERLTGNHTDGGAYRTAEKYGIVPAVLETIGHMGVIVTALEGADQGLARNRAPEAVPSQAPVNWERPAAAENARPGTYTTEIRWGIQDVQVRPDPNGPGFWGERISQSNPRVDAYERQINPNNESYYLPHPNGGYVQFENLVGTSLQDGKLVVSPQSLYHVNDLPAFAQDAVLKEATRQVEAASANRLRVQWLVSDPAAASQLGSLFHAKGVDIQVTHLPSTSN